MDNYKALVGDGQPWSRPAEQDNLRFENLHLHLHLHRNRCCHRCYNSGSDRWTCLRLLRWRDRRAHPTDCRYVADFPVSYLCLSNLGPGIQNIILALVYKEWVTPCRVSRGDTLVATEENYMEAARAMGAGNWHILIRSLLPNVMASVIVVASLRTAWVILMEASLRAFSVWWYSLHQPHGEEWLPGDVITSFKPSGSLHFRELPSSSS